METSLLEIYLGRPGPTSQIILLVWTSFWYFVAWRNLSLDIFQIKGIQIQLGKLGILLCPDIQINTVYTLLASLYDLVKVGSDTTIESKFDKRTAPSLHL